MKNIRRFVGGLALLAMGMAGPAHAQYPDQPITLVVPFATGGATDALARGVCTVIAAQLGQPCVVTNRSGAGTAIANAFVSQSRPDGYTLLLTTGSFSVVNALSRNLGYAGASAFTPVAYLGEAPNALVVPADSRFKTVGDLIAAARTPGGNVNFASSGVGSLTHLSGELLRMMGGFEMTHIPYRGAAPLTTDLLGGRVDSAFTSLPSSMPLVQSGRLRLLAVTSEQRSPMLPDVPTVAEAGVTGYATSAYYAVFGPANLPPAVMSRLAAALSQVEKDERVRVWAEREGLVLAYGGPERLAEVARVQEARWREVGQRQGIAID